MRLMVGCDLEEFQRYYRRCGIVEDLALEWEGLGETEEDHIRRDASHLIVFREGDQIIGDAIWHESNTREHTPDSGDWRDRNDTEILEKVLGGSKHFVELHELWLVKTYRGRGYAKEFFDFFEDFVRKRGHQDIVYCAFDLAAVALCRRRGYKEAYGVEAVGRTCYVLYLHLKG